MTAREEILGRIRAALHDADTSEVPVPRSYRDVASTPETIDLFCERVADYRAVVVRCADVDVPARIAEALADADSVIVPDGFAWPVPGGIADTHLDALALDSVGAVVTAASVGIAQTGTIVLSHGPGEGRRALSLVPDLHVCVVRADEIVGTVPDAVARLDPASPTTWISGPSATSDIELNRVEGVHGPRRLHVIVVSG